MRPTELFRFCPRCGVPRAPENIGQIPLRCAACNFTFYFNPTVAAAAWVYDPQGRVLLIRRAKDPAAGKFGIPGGFIDLGETAEEGLRREVREEVGLEIDRIRFLMSCPNLYLYREVTYPVVDLVFTADGLNPENAKPLDGVAGIEWKFPGDVDPEELAFPSMRVTLAAVRGGSTA
jgi:8-oxo-dGTP pyrophosphatase MutT (NUDIX family)